MPKRLVCPAHEKIELVDYEVPAEPPADRVIVRNTHGAEKHGTMTTFWKGHGNSRGRWDAERAMHVSGEGVVWGYPIPLGNMQVGVVEKVGSAVEGVKAGDRFVHFAGFQPLSVVHPDHAWPINADTSWKAATCLDPATFALCALRDGNMRVGDNVAIFSLGAIGLMAVQLAKLAGANQIIAIDPLANRRVVAEKTGATLTLDPVGNDVGRTLREVTDWRGVDVVIEYSGAMEAMQAATRGVAFGGNIVAGAFPPPYKAGLDFGGEAHMNRPNIIFSRTESDPNRDHPRWDNGRIRETCMTLIRDHRIDAEDIVTPVVRFGDDLVEHYLQISRAPETNVKFGVEY